MSNSAVSRVKAHAGLILSVALVLTVCSVAEVCAQSVPWFSGQYPLVFLPGLQGEFKCSVIRTGIESGKQVIPSDNISWDLKKDFNMNRQYLFADLMVGLRAGRFGVRAHWETREFVGLDRYQGNPDLPVSTARLEYSGIRVGADVYLFQWRGLRVGINADYNLYRPIFSEGIRTGLGGKKIIGETPTTAGLHVFYGPSVNFYDFSPVLEARCRWPVAGTELTDLEFSAGVNGPDTVLGSVALKFGYRSTSLEFPAVQHYNGVQVRTVFDALFTGWFGELAYYY